MSALLITVTSENCIFVISFNDHHVLLLDHLLL